MGHYNLDLLERLAYEPIVSVAEFKNHQVIQHDLDDALILEYLLAASEFVENEMERSLMLSRYRLYFDNWRHACEANWIQLEKGPIRAIEAVRYLDEDSVEQFLDTDLFYSSARGTDGRVRFGSADLPTLADENGLDQVHVQYVAGYGEYTAVTGYPYNYPMLYTGPVAADGMIPAGAKQAARLIAGHYYENRESVVVGTISGELAQGARDLIHQKRVLGV